MQKLHTFWHSFSQSFISPKYYADVLKAPISFSIKFFLFFFLIFGTIYSIYISYTVFIPLSKIIQVLPDRISQFYPQELEITISNGKVSTNVEEPYFIPFSQIEEFIEGIESDILGTTTEPKYLLVIDTNATFEEFDVFRTYALLTETDLIYINDNGNKEVVSLSDIDNLTINHQLITQMVDKVFPYLQFISPILALLLWFLIIIFLPIFNLIYLAIFTCITWVMSAIMKYEITYQKAYQLGLHLIVPITTIFAIVQFLGIPLQFPLLRTILMSLFMLVILLKLKEITIDATPAQENKPATEYSSEPA